MQIQPIIPNKLKYYGGMRTEHKEIPSSNTNMANIPSFVDAKSLVNISFKSNRTELHDAICYGTREEFDKLIYDPNTKVNEFDQWYNCPLYCACDSNDEDCVYRLEKLLQRPDLKLNPEIEWFDPLLFIAHDCTPKRHSHLKDIALKKIEVLLQHPCIDTHPYLEYLKEYEEASYWRRDEFIEAWPEIDEMVKAYKPGVDKRKNIIAFNPVIDAHRILSLDEVWTPKEKTEIKKLLDKKDYNKLALLFAEKGFALNEETKKIHELEIQTEKSVRENVTEQIRIAEKEKAEQALQEKHIKLEQDFAKKEKTLQKVKEKAEKELEKRIKAVEKRENEAAQLKAQAEEQNKALDNTIKNYQTLITEDVINARDALAVGYRALYGADSEELPKTMDFDEQTIYVLNVLGKRQDKLTATSSETPNKITKAIQDDTGNISLDGLKFLERAIDACKEKFSEKDLLDSIKCVKGSYGLFDMKKTALFISNIAWKDNSIRSVIQKVEKYGLK